LAEKWQRHPAADLRGCKPLLQFTIFSFIKSVKYFYLKMKNAQIDLKTGLTFFAGENGTGRSTLLEAIARKSGLTAWGGEKTHIIHRKKYTINNLNN